MIPTSPRPKSTNKMENIKPYFYLGSAATSFSSSSGAESCESDPAFLFYGSPDSGVNDLTATFQELTIDVDGMVQELFERNKRDTDSIRQDFIRNGIDSSIAECVPTRRLPPPGFGALSKWPLSACENNSSTAGTNLKDNKIDEPERKANKSTYQSNRRKRSKENEDYACSATTTVRSRKSTWTTAVAMRKVTSYVQSCASMCARTVRPLDSWPTPKSTAQRSRSSLRTT
nr:uncharacterized protein LOC109413230 isoform X1 [Aedes albopictus]XP_019542503.2 uncharacterized protein LOC109413230 isoform X1 [Aedes albopictus]